MSSPAGSGSAWASPGFVARATVETDDMEPLGAGLIGSAGEFGALVAERLRLSQAERSSDEERAGWWTGSWHRNGRCRS
jgi:hypothetical protein